jgi:hypothetical protein
MTARGRDSFSQFRNEVSNTDKMKKFAFRVEVRNYSMRLLTAIMEQKRISHTELAEETRIPIDVIVGVLRRSEAHSLSRENLSSIGSSFELSSSTDIGSLFINLQNLVSIVSEMEGQSALSKARRNSQELSDNAAAVRRVLAEISGRIAPSVFGQ